MSCRHCFHYSVCATASSHTDVTMCKQFVESSRVLCGSAYDVIVKELEKLKESSERLERELNLSESDRCRLERELELLRIIKQTLEMQSGMKFDF